MTAQEAYAKLIEHMKEISILQSTEQVLEWDRDTYLPRKGGDHRAEQMAQLSRVAHEWFTDPKVDKLLATIQQSDLVADTGSPTAVNVREWRRLYDREIKLPTEFVSEFARTTSKAQEVWAEARKKSDFELFAPNLAKVIDLCRRKADFVGYTTEPYDALLDEFEPGGKVAEVDLAFKAMRTDLVKLIGKIKDAPRKPDIGIIKRPWDVDRQRIFSETVVSAMGYDFEGGRIDETVHPFCTALGPYDTRILTRYYPADIVEGLSGGMHEAGHALYDMTRSDKEHWGTPAGETDSLAIHESQSRLWENMVGRSRQFWVYFFPQLQRLFKQEIEGVNLDQFYGAMNWVAPSLVRLEADEATYNLHIMLRFEIERAIIAGDIKVADIPGEWNERVKRYLGVEVDKDANGCLQDVHWSHGIFGYFPTYALGNMHAAQYWRQAQQDLPGLLDDFSTGNFDRLFTWLRDNIHSQGSRYFAAELCQQVTGEPLSHKPLLDYLYDKYEDIYGISRN